jgi:hypothetical protein
MRDSYVRADDDPELPCGEERCGIASGRGLAGRQIDSCVSQVRQAKAARLETKT